jgi:hypothetical protein
MASSRLSPRRLLIGFLVIITISWFHVLASFLQSTTNDSTSTRSPLLNHNDDEPLAIVVGLPKSGTTSLYHFFSCNGYYTTHYCCCGSNQTQYPCTNGRQMSQRLQDNLQQGRPLLKGIASGRNVVHTQLDGESQGTYSYFLPQHYFLDQLDQAAPHAIWILPLRPPAKWKRSVQQWLDLEHRLKKEYHQRLSPSTVPDLENDDFLMDFYQRHTQRIREYCRHHRRGSCIEVEIDEDPDDVGRRLERFFPGTRAKCWGRHNTGPFFQAIIPPNSNGG